MCGCIVFHSWLLQVQLSDTECSGKQQVMVQFHAIHGGDLNCFLTLPWPNSSHYRHLRRCKIFLCVFQINNFKRCTRMSQHSTCNSFKQEIIQISTPHSWINKSHCISKFGLEIHEVVHDEFTSLCRYYTSFKSWKSMLYKCDWLMLYRAIKSYHFWG